MDEKYFAQKIEDKWQTKWRETGAFEAEIDAEKPKFYQLEMLPYPSGNLHMGHVRNYSIGDALAWYKRLKGFNVLHPIGWDSFGQPAEDAAIKRGVNPREWTETNIKYMTGQLQRLGLSYDWRRQMFAHRPEYYKFDQWFFVKMFELGLAYKKKTQVNWCDTDKAVLSNEQASGGLCWRCGNPVTKRDLEQWFLRTTNYADQLLDDMAEIEAGWAEKVLKRQRDWIGRSEGAFVDFAVKDADEKIRVFTTRIDTIYGANAVVVAAEHPIIEANAANFSGETKQIIAKIKADKLKVTDHDAEVEKEGVDTGLKAINPFSGEEIPIWAANYVLIEYGTGAVMSVPAHDERDFEFARKYNLPIEIVISAQKDVSGAKDNLSEQSDVLFDTSDKTSDTSDKTSDTSDKTSDASDKTSDTSDKTSDTSDKTSDTSDKTSDASDKTFDKSDITSDASDKTFDVSDKTFDVSDKTFDSSNILSDHSYKVSDASNALSDHSYETSLSLKDDYSMKKSSSADSVNDSRLSEAFSDYGFVINSGEWSGKTSVNAKKAMTKYAAERGFGEAATTYRLRDWGVSRQRFWGAPIPIVYCDDCGIVPEKVENLPVLLPDAMQISGEGESPLAKDADFVNTICPNCGKKAKRETDTMDTFVDSSWYYFRYTDAQNDELPFSPEAAAYWTPVDQYVGGDDHAVMHLIYTRFWTKAMRDLKLVDFNEPVKRLLTQGMVIGETFFTEIPNPDEPEGKGKRKYFAPSSVVVERDAKGKILAAKSAEGEVLKSAIERMSKSKGNGVDPDEMVEIYGADAARLFVLFAAPAENELVWNESGIEGAVRFLQRVWRFVWKWAGKMENGKGKMENGRFDDSGLEFSAEAKKLRRKTHQSIKRVGENFENLQFNTPVAALMELSNALYEFKAEPETASEADVCAVKEAAMSLVLMLAPFAPHTAEELYANIVGNGNGLLANDARFPEFIEELTKADEIEIPVQVNGKLRSRILAAPDAANEELEAAALADEKVLEWTNGKEIVKVVVVPKRLVNIVVKSP